IRQIFRSSSANKAQKTMIMTTTAHNVPSNTASTDTMHSSPVTVLELFQSQGCNSCPPANDFLISNFSNDLTTLLLTYEVTYWDNLGWADTFGNRRWDERQRDYAAVLRQRSVYTPQVIADGGARPLASWRDLPQVLGQRGVAELNVNIMTQGDGRVVEVGSWKGENRSWNAAQVVAVWYEEQPVDVVILRGENRGLTLPHRNVVRHLDVLGDYPGGKEVFEVPDDRMGMRLCVIVQAGRGGKILGA
ncbi:hypothetical protein BKA61DRAFT_445623, partial [Leptodontidium sp. MPI-SDFR-AT-0119]